MTLKQENTVKDLLENAGKPIGKAMLENGYAPATAKNPKELTDSKAWPELLEKYLPDDKLLKVHDEGLTATKIHGSLTEPDREVPDIPTRLKAVELGYKVKGRLSSTIVAQQFNVGGEMQLEFIGNESNTK
jgi:hypothetical protein